MSDRLVEFGPLIDAGPTRDHIGILRESGLSVRTLHRLSGVSMKSLASLVWGVEGREPSGQVRQETAERLLAVRPRLELLDPVAKVGAHGTRRRLQALQSLGWSPRQLSVGLSASSEYVGKISRGEVPKVRVTTALAIRGLYDRLWDLHPPQSDQRQRMIVTRMRRKAARNGWAPPMAWDDETIDDPAAVPDGAVRRPHALRKLPEGSELLWLVDELDETHEAIAQRFDAQVKTVKSAIIRARRKAASGQELGTAA